MTRSVDQLIIDNFVDTGLTTPLARYTFSLRITYTDDAGVQHVSGPTTHTFPNELSVMPLANRKKHAIQMIDEVVRVTLGLTTWSDLE